MKNHLIILSCLFALLISCQEENTESSKNIKDTTFTNSVQPENVDKDFMTFIDRFNKDSVFQVSRINFPFQQIQSGIETEKDSIILINKSGFEMMNFTIKENKSEFDKWKQIIKIEGEKAIIQIRGIDNGIYVDYVFEKQKSKWKFIKVLDKSD